VHKAVKTEQDKADPSTAHLCA